MYDTLVQSNSIRGKQLHTIADKTVQEILDNITPMLGPGARDAFIYKNDAPYYTRDGKEVMESIRLDNELANIIHHIFYQALYHQGKEVGDGSTTLGVFYGHLYQLIREKLDSQAEKGTNREIYPLVGTINKLRKEWKTTAEEIVEELKKRTVPMTEEKLASMLYTCTQDLDLTTKIYSNLKDAILAGAYIVPRKSNIASDFNVTVYNRPTFKVTKQFSMFPVANDLENTVVYYCAGMLDVPHFEIFEGIAASTPEMVYGNMRPTVIILCHGVTENTRRSLRQFVSFAKSHIQNVAALSNIAIYTLNDYRTFSHEESEDIGTIITGEPGLGGIVQPLTYANLLYETFCKGNPLFNTAGQDTPEWMKSMDTFDVDVHLVEVMKTCYNNPYHVILDDVEGIALDKPLNRIAQDRYDKLVKEINEEKSPIRKVDLNKRLRKMYGMFIDIEIGSTLLKDSQRKYELILDAIISASEGAKTGVLEGNSMLHVCQILLEKYERTAIENLILDALLLTISDLIANYRGVGVWMDIIRDRLLVNIKYPEKWGIKGFNFNKGGSSMWSEKTPATPLIDVVTIGDNGAEMRLDTTVVEPVEVMTSIIENSTLPLEVAMTEIVHISGNCGYMNNYIGEE